MSNQANRKTVNKVFNFTSPDGSGTVRVAFSQEVNELIPIITSQYDIGVYNGERVEWSSDGTPNGMQTECYKKICKTVIDWLRENNHEVSCNIPCRIAISNFINVDGDGEGTLSVSIGKRIDDNSDKYVVVIVDPKVYDKHNPHKVVEIITDRILGRNQEPEKPVELPIYDVYAHGVYTNGEISWGEKIKDATVAKKLSAWLDRAQMTIDELHQNEVAVRTIQVYHEEEFLGYLVFGVTRETGYRNFVVYIPPEQLSDNTVVKSVVKDVAKSLLRNVK